VRFPRRSNVDAALFFAVVVAIVAEQGLKLLLRDNHGVARVLHASVAVLVMSTLLMALPALLLRLVDDLTTVPRWLMRLAVAGLVASVIGLFFALSRRLPTPIILLYIVYFVGFTGYCAVACVHAGHTTTGVTRRRLRAAALATLSLGLEVLMAGFALVAPEDKAVWVGLSSLLAVGAGLGYYLGFAPPSWIKRAWQEPELRAFLRRTASLTRLHTTHTIIEELEALTADCIGAPRAAIALWVEEDHTLRVVMPDGAVLHRSSGEFITGRAFARQEALFVANAQRDDPIHAAEYRDAGVSAMIAVPITLGEARLGVLALYTSRAAIFAEDDLALAQVLADQTAVILENRTLVADAAALQARAEIMQLKDDFLSAAAHDLRTPITSLLGYSQLLQRHARRHPEEPSDPAMIDRVVSVAQRMAAFVGDLLENARLENEVGPGPCAPVDMIDLVGQACVRQSTATTRCLLQASGPMTAVINGVRITRVVDNLLQNAVKYSPGSPIVHVTLWERDDMVHVSVADEGIGIPAADIAHVFDRFRRGSNVSGDHVAGIGLGLFICRHIVAQHGGELSVTSEGSGHGSTFHLVFPRVPPGVVAESPSPTTQDRPRDGEMDQGVTQRALVDRRASAAHETAGLDAGDALEAMPA